MTRDQLVSAGSMIAVALALPVLVRLSGSIQRWWVGAEGRLAIITVNTERPLGPMPVNWRALAQGGEELKTFLDGDTGKKVAALKPQLIRFDHIYNGFEVVSRNGNELMFNWTQLDILVEKVLATGARPYFSLGYMPPAISKSDIVDEPKDYEEWALVVQKTIEHYSGEKAISGVYYEVWNEPDLFGRWKMGGGKDYLKLYTYAARGAGRARVVREFKLGGPATTGLYKNWIDRFLPYVLQNRLRLDFVSWHRYDLNLSAYARDVMEVEKWLDSHPSFVGVEKIISELGPSSDKAAVNDSMLGAVHLIAVAREGIYKVDELFNFSIKDAPDSKGGWGIVGKPRYDSIVMLNRLGDERLVVTGEGTMVKALAAQKEGVFQVLVFNYDPKGQNTENVPVTFTNLPDGQYVLTKSLLRGARTSEDVISENGQVQTYIGMTANTAVLVELQAK